MEIIWACLFSTVYAVPHLHHPLTRILIDNFGLNRPLLKSEWILAEGRGRGLVSV